MTDIISISDDLGMFDSQIARAANILSVQVGSLTYAPLLGIDLKYFLSENYRFQNESFKAYLIDRLANNSINVSSVIESLENLYAQYTFKILADESGQGLISR